jgi:YcaO-like protein with predicted kinase domain
MRWSGLQDAEVASMRFEESIGAATEPSGIPASAKAIDIGGTVRDALPGCTLRRVLPILRTVGITRVANITGLDHVGVPTWMIVRPLSRSLTVSQGKGFTHELAKTSGIMESIELYHAEHFTPAGEWAPLSQFTKIDDYIDPAFLAVRPDATLDLQSEIYWVQGRDLVSGRPKWIPHELFDADCTKQSANPIFCQSSNGLSLGNSVEESILHGLCEVVERDQVSFWLATAQYTKQLANTLVSLDTVDHPICLSLINRCREAGLDVFIWYAATNINVPVFTCAVADRTGRTLYPIRTNGHGCHPLKAIALSRAITEALQSRLTHIAGTRDDMFWEDYARKDFLCDLEANKSWLDKLRVSEAAIDYQALPGVDKYTTIRDLLEHVKDKLIEARCDTIIFVDLLQESLGIPVTYVCVPKLEQKIVGPFYKSGPRMLEYCERLKQC